MKPCLFKKRCTNRTTLLYQATPGAILAPDPTQDAKRLRAVSAEWCQRIPVPPVQWWQNSTSGLSTAWRSWPLGWIVIYDFCPEEFRSEIFLRLGINVTKYKVYFFWTFFFVVQFSSFSDIFVGLKCAFASEIFQTKIWRLCFGKLTPKGRNPTTHFFRKKYFVDNDPPIWPSPSFWAICLPKIEYQPEICMPDFQVWFYFVFVCEKFESLWI